MKLTLFIEFKINVYILSDRCELKEPEKAIAMQDKLVSCLLYLLSKRPSGTGTALCKIITILTDIRNLTEYEIETAKKFLFELPLVPQEQDVYDKMLLIKEFFG